jgi:3-oxoacyl-[acyl-carrier protein] reductase
MNGKNFVVTGGASGLGLATGKLLARRGAQVAIIDADRVGLPAALKEIASSAAITPSAVAGDIGPRREANQLFAAAIGDFDRVDGVVNCAGIYPRRPILEISDEDWDLEWRVNVRGT